MVTSEKTWYLIEGINPEPWRASEGSLGRKNGKVFIQFHKPGTVRDYQEALKETFLAEYPDASITESVISLELIFWRQMTNVADATNLQKSTEDALQGVLFKNDQQVKFVSSYIAEQLPDTDPAILIGISGFPVEYHLSSQRLLQSYERVSSVLPVSFDGRIDFDIEDVF